MNSAISSDLPVPVITAVTGAVSVPASKAAATQGTAAAVEPSRVSSAEGTRSSGEAARLLGGRDSSQDSLKVTVDAEHGVVVRIVDESGKVVRQVPPEELVALSKRLGEVIGLLFDKKA